MSPTRFKFRQVSRIKSPAFWRIYIIILTMFPDLFQSSVLNLLVGECFVNLLKLFRLCRSPKCLLSSR